MTTPYTALALGDAALFAQLGPVHALCPERVQTAGTLGPGFATQTRIQPLKVDQ